MSELSPPRSYAGVPVAARVDARRATILDVGFTLFSTQGYTATSVQQICSAARVARRDFYTLFPSREALLIALLEQVMGGAQEVLSELLPTQQQIGSLDDPVVVAALDPVGRIETAVRRHLHYYYDDRRRARLKCVESVGVSEAVEEVRRALMQGFVDYLNGVFLLLVAAKLVETRPFVVTATALMGAFDATVASFAASVGSQPPIEDVIDQMTRMVLNAFELGHT